MRGSLVLVLCLAGCDALVDADYRGEPSGQLRGVLLGEPSPRNPPLEIGIGWTVPDAEVGDLGFELITEPSNAEFGGRFTLDLYPPPDHLIGNPNPDRHPRAEGYLVVVSRATVEGAVGFTPLGEYLQRKLIYLPDAVEPDSFTAQRLCGALSAGFHLMEINASGTPRPPECGAEWEAADGLDTLIEVELR